MIAAKAGGKPYAELVEELVVEPHGPALDLLRPGTYPPEVIARLAHGYFENTACAEYQPPDCAESWNKPLLGRDVREDSTSWAQAAGGAISSARDVDAGCARSSRAGWCRRSSRRNGCRWSRSRPASRSPTLTPEDPQGFALGLVSGLVEPVGPVWFYQGTTLGYRTLYAWYQADDLLVTVQTNSQPDDDANDLRAAATAIRDAVTGP